MSRELLFIRRLTGYLFIGWTALLFLFVLYSGWNEFHSARELALQEARISVKKDLGYRRWVASHGGVYVPVTERTQPNPYLDHIPKRDVETTDGDKLTLMNPAYVLSQMMRDYDELYGVKGHITSTKLLNPANAPDAWEKKGLAKIEQSREAYYEFTELDGQSVIRLINPLITTKACLKCHGHQGYQVGDVRGGVTVAIPLEKYYAVAMEHTAYQSLFMLLVWISGAYLIRFGKNKANRAVFEKIRNYEQQVYALVDMIEQRDSYTAGHTRRVAEYSVAIGVEMGLSDDDLDDLYRAAMVHDIGKISTPDAILLKPGRLTSLEYSLIKEHVTSGYELLSKVDIYSGIAEIIKHHHERYDGTGYPAGLSGDAVPLASHIMAVADSFDAMTTDRIYKGRKTIEDALQELAQMAGKQYHPRVIDAALKALKNVEISQHISQAPSSGLEQERFSFFFKDQLTHLYNRNYLNFILAKNKNGGNDSYLSLTAIFVHHFSRYNLEHGWESGNQLLERIAAQLEAIFPEEMIFRLFGDDFVVLHTDRDSKLSLLEQLTQHFAEEDIAFSYQHFDIEARSINSVEDLEKLLFASK